jgi:hypothetical protein
MTPADEARFIALWQQGLTTDAIAQQLGLKAGTARSRAYTLQQRGLIMPRPKGGNRRDRAMRCNKDRNLLKKWIFESATQ